MTSSTDGDRRPWSNTRARQASISAWLDKVSGKLMPLILGLLGVVLLADAIAYFMTGAPLF